MSTEHLFAEDVGTATAPTVSVASPAPVKILLVDDEPKNLTALETVLAADDRVLVRAGSGAEALRQVLHDDFAAVLLDVHMPVMDGFETAELIRGRERSRETPIIFLTAAISGDVFVAKGYSLGAVDYLIKPFDPDILPRFCTACWRAQPATGSWRWTAKGTSFPGMRAPAASSATRIRR
jgi:CheY-like chemotaxis protein